MHAYVSELPPWISGGVSDSRRRRHYRVEHETRLRDIPRSAFPLKAAANAPIALPRCPAETTQGSGRRASAYSPVRSRARSLQFSTRFHSPRLPESLPLKRQRLVYTLPATLVQQRFLYPILTSNHPLPSHYSALAGPIQGVACCRHTGSSSLGTAASRSLRSRVAFPRGSPFSATAFRVSAERARPLLGDPTFHRRRKFRQTLCIVRNGGCPSVPPGPLLLCLAHPRPPEKRHE